MEQSRTCLACGGTGKPDVHTCKRWRYDHCHCACPVCLGSGHIVQVPGQSRRDALADAESLWYAAFWASAGFGRGSTLSLYEIHGLYEDLCESELSLRKVIKDFKHDGEVLFLEYRVGRAAKALFRAVPGLRGRVAPNNTWACE